MRRLIATALIAATVAIPSNASAHQPYGGCDEAWQAPNSGGATHCRQHRWLVRPRVVVGPLGVVRFNRLPALASDDIDGSYGYWNASTMGNHRGDSFIVIPANRNGGHRIVYVRFPRS